MKLKRNRGRGRSYAICKNIVYYNINSNLIKCFSDNNCDLVHLPNHILNDINRTRDIIISLKNDDLIIVNSGFIDDKSMTNLIHTIKENHKITGIYFIRHYNLNNNIYNYRFFKSTFFNGKR